MRVLTPIARTMLRQGVTAHEFVSWVETAFVHAARDVLTEQGKDPSFSRISAITGIHRHAVSTILRGASGTAADSGGEKEYQRHRLARVLSGWFESPVFTDQDGRPLPLAVEGKPVSFAELVRTHSGDIYPGIILDELVRVGAARIREDGKIEAVSRRYTSGGADAVSIEHARVVAGDVLRTIEHNILAGPGDRLYEDSAIVHELPPEAVPRLARMLEQRAAAFLDDLEGWLSELQSARPQPRQSYRPVRAGVRIVMVAEPLAGSGKDAGDRENSGSAPSGE